MELITKKDKQFTNTVETLQGLIQNVKEFHQNIRPFLNGERYITDKQLSEIIKLSRRSIQEYRNNGLLSYIHLSGKILYKESDIIKFLEKNYVSAWRNE